MAMVDSSMPEDTYGTTRRVGGSGSIGATYGVSPGPAAPSMPSPEPGPSAPQTPSAPSPSQPSQAAPMGSAQWVRDYYKSRNVTPFATSPDYWAQKWMEWGASDPTYFQQRLSQADEFLGRPQGFDWMGAGLADPMASYNQGYGMGSGSADMSNLMAMIAALGPMQQPTQPAPEAAPAPASNNNVLNSAAFWQAISGLMTGGQTGSYAAPTFSGAQSGSAQQIAMQKNQALAQLLALFAGGQ